MVRFTHPTTGSIPMPSDDLDFIDRLLESNPALRHLMEERRRECEEGRVSSLESVRERLAGLSEDA
jgi:hypothetical protein